jgi:putative aldouronate transport system permease protein
MIKRSGGERIFNVLNLLFLGILSVCALYPIYHVLLASFSSSGALMAHSGLLLWPAGFSTAAYDTILSNKNIWTGYGNTIFIVIVGTALSLLVTSMAAYPLSRKSFGARRFFMLLITFTMMFSAACPRFLVVKSVGMYDSVWSLICPVLINTTNLIIMRTAFSEIPDSWRNRPKLTAPTIWLSMRALFCRWRRRLRRCFACTMAWPIGIPGLRRPFICARAANFRCS